MRKNKDNSTVTCFANAGVLVCNRLSHNTKTRELVTSVAGFLV